jgi:hypothetical protein
LNSEVSGRRRLLRAHRVASKYHLLCSCRLGLTVQLLLRIDRPDLAEQRLKAMQAIDDEAALTQLSTAFVYLALVRVQQRLCLFFCGDA